MMMSNGKLQTILVATDLSESGNRALAAAADLSFLSGARVHVVHAHEEPAMGADLLSSQRSLHIRRAALLDAVGDMLPRTIWSESVHVRIGHPAEVILNEAERIGAGLIVLGPHRDRGIVDRILGSTAEQVMRRAEVPCLLVNGPLRMPATRIVVPTDFSRTARKAAVTAARWGELFARGTTPVLTLAHVIPAPTRPDMGWARAEIEEDLANEAGEMMREAAISLPIETRILVGRGPADELLLNVELSNTDLMVIGTRGDPMLIRALLGSVSSAMVRRAPIPMLLVPPSKRDRAADSSGAVEIELDRQAITA